MVRTSQELLTRESLRFAADTEAFLMNLSVSLFTHRLWASRQTFWCCLIFEWMRRSWLDRDAFRGSWTMDVCDGLILFQVRERDLPMVTHTLSSEFTLFRVVNGETVAAHNLGVTNGFVKPKLGGFNRPRFMNLSSFLNFIRLIFTL